MVRVFAFLLGAFGGVLPVPGQAWAHLRNKPFPVALSVATVLVAIFLPTTPSRAQTCLGGGSYNVSGADNATCVLGVGDSVTISTTGSITASPGVSASGSVTAGSVTNEGVITSASSSPILVQTNGALTGGINNSGTITGTSAFGISVDNGTISSGITNSGTISGTGGTGTSAGVSIQSSGVNGGIRNHASGTITGFINGVLIGSTTTVTGGISNDGAIAGTHPSGEGVNVNSSTISGGITNSLTGSITGGNTGVVIGGLSSVDSVTNSGTITGTIGLNGAGVLVQNSTISGAIINDAAGSISSGANGNGIGIDNNGNVGSITNSGTITAGQSGISVESGTVSGGITNSGTITGTNVYGIGVSNSTVSGGITNNLSGSISGNDGINIGGNPFGSNIGSIVNNGTITGVFGAGIVIFGSTNTNGGGIVNSGAITGNGPFGIGYGIHLRSGSNFVSGITNSGTISGGANGVGIQIDSGSNINGGINNTSGGAITGGTDGINIAAGATVSGNVTNAGSITGGTNALNLGNTAGAFTVINTGTLNGNVLLGINKLQSGNGGNAGTINGNLTFSSGSAYAVQMSPAAADRTNVTGTAALAGSLHVAVTSGVYSPRTYTILNATGGVTSTFTGLPNNAALALNGLGALVRNPHVVYDANNVYLVLDPNPNPAASLLPSSAPGNQRGVAYGIDKAITNGATLSSAFNTLLSLTGPAYTNALTQVSGEAGAGGGRQAGTRMMGSFLALALNPHAGSPGGNPGGVGIGRGFAAEAKLPPEAAYAYAAVTPKDRQTPSSVFSPNWAIWGQAYGGYNKTDGDTNAGTHDTTANSYGFATGLDYLFSHDTLIGFALAGGATNYSLSAGLGSGRSDVFQVGVYGTKKFGAAYVSAALSYAEHWMTTNRTVTVAGTDNLAANFNAHSIGARLESGYRFDLRTIGITPYAALQVQNFRTPSYTETATSGSNAFALSYDAKSTTAVRTELGAWFDKTMAVYGRALLTLRTRIAWAHDHSSNESASAVFQTLPGSNFTVNGTGTVPNSALLSAGGELRLAGGVSLGAKFDGEFAGRSQTYAGTGTVRYAW